MEESECAMDMSSGWSHGQRAKEQQGGKERRWESCLVLCERINHCIGSASRCIDRRAQSRREREPGTASKLSADCSGLCREN